jgi:hypothetical protein
MCIERPNWWYEMDIEEEMEFTQEELDVMYEEYLKDQELIAENEILQEEEYGYAGSFL